MANENTNAIENEGGPGGANKEQMSRRSANLIFFFARMTIIRILASLCILMRKFPKQGVRVRSSPDQD